MAARLVLAAALCPLALAFSDTLPLVAWSSHSSAALDRLVVHSSSPLLESILYNDDACAHDAILLVEQPGLHASDLRSLSPNTKLARTLSASPSARQFPYVPDHSAADISLVAEAISSRCGSRLVSFTAGQGGASLERGTKHVICLNMPHLDESGSARRDAMARHESLFSSELSALESTFSNLLIVYTGSPLASHSHSKRQSPDVASPPARPVLELGPHVYANTTLPEGGILKRYQLLTPGLITVLLVTFFLLIPIVIGGINALASIQSPLRVEAPKGYSAAEKKSQ